MVPSANMMKSHCRGMGIGADVYLPSFPCSCSIKGYRISEGIKLSIVVFWIIMSNNRFSTIVYNNNYRRLKYIDVIYKTTRSSFFIQIKTIIDNIHQKQSMMHSHHSWIGGISPLHKRAGGWRRLTNHVAHEMVGCIARDHGPTA
jgi:hypothetical protein